MAVCEMALRSALFAIAFGGMSLTKRKLSQLVRKEEIFIIHNAKVFQNGPG